MNRETKFVRNIEDGVAIDHITAGKAMRCLRIINPNTKNNVLIGMNFDSEKYGLKDFIKIENYFPSEEILSKIALIAPNATISVIKKGKVVRKSKVKPPKEYSGRIMCINPKCVTKTELYLTPSYTVESIKPLNLRCKYCDKVLTEEDVVTQNF